MAENGLTIKELCDILAEYPDDMEVFVDGYEGGVDSLVAAHIIKRLIRKNVNSEDEWWEGRHEVAFFDGEKARADCEGIILSR